MKIVYVQLMAHQQGPIPPVLKIRADELVPSAGVHEYEVKRDGVTVGHLRSVWGWWMEDIPNDNPSIGDLT